MRNFESKNQKCPTELVISIFDLVKGLIVRELAEWGKKSMGDYLMFLPNGVIVLKIGF